MPSDDPIRHPLPSGLAAPARRALAGAGIADLEHLAAWTEGELAGLHGIGPNALRLLRSALADAGLTFEGSGSG